MGRVRQKDTAPELSVRRILFSNGFRYRLHVRSLPGSPDIVLPRFKTAIFVHGCFWHRHAACRRTTTPKTRTEFWQAKFDANMARDSKNEALLKELGWRVIVVWECETTDGATLVEKLMRLLRTS